MSTYSGIHRIADIPRHRAPRVAKASWFSRVRAAFRLEPDHFSHRTATALGMRGQD